MTDEHGKSTATDSEALWLLAGLAEAIVVPRDSSLSEDSGPGPNLSFHNLGKRIDD
jgi:hypothetical protein